MTGDPRNPKQPFKLAFALIDAIQSALSNGTGHYDKAGNKLEDVTAVLRCLRDEGEVTLSRDGELPEQANYGRTAGPRAPRAPR